jgi:heme exporter protein D
VGEYVYVAVPAATLIAALGLAGYTVKKREITKREDRRARARSGTSKRNGT